MAAGTLTAASLAFAAGELNERIHNILERGFLDAYSNGPYQDEAILSTLFRFGQYFGWSEIVRRALRAPDGLNSSDAASLEQLQGQVGRTFATDGYGPGSSMIWREAQRAVGELMITQDGDITDTIGVAGFWAAIDKFRPWLNRMEDLMKERPANWDKGDLARLRDIQVALTGLVAEGNSPKPNQLWGRIPRLLD